MRPCPERDSGHSIAAVTDALRRPTLFHLGFCEPGDEFRRLLGLGQAAGELVWAPDVTLDSKADGDARLRTAFTLRRIDGEWSDLILSGPVDQVVRVERRTILTRSRKRRLLWAFVCEGCDRLRVKLLLDPCQEPLFLGHCCLDLRRTEFGGWFVVGVDDRC